MSHIARGFSPGFGSDVSFSQPSGAHPNPLFKYFQGFVPRSIKESFIWAEFLFSKSPHIYAALQKLSDYAITDITYQTDADREQERHQNLFEKTLHMKGIMKAVLRDRRIYGNSFVSVYLPFNRFLVCKKCQNREKITNIDYKFKYRSLSFLWKCKSCGSQTSTHLDAVVDRPSNNPEKINVIRWDPKRINIAYNSLTGEKEYSYEIPERERRQLRQGLKTLLNSTPKGFIKAAKEKRVFKFNKGKLFHMKIDAPAGISSAWGISPLLVTLDQFLYTAALRKANEAIASDYLVPFRVLHPAQAVASIDPATSMSIGRWMDETKRNVRQWRKDPLHIQFAPVPLGVTQMGGNGRSLLTFPEIEGAEKAILAALGVPQEFVYGGLSFTGSSVTLRMLENQLMNDTHEMVSMLQWIGDTCAEQLGWSKVKYDMIPFKLIDDVQQKNMLMKLNQAEQLLSKQTMADVFGYDLKEERRLQAQEALEETRDRLELDRKLRELESNVSEKAHRQAEEGGLGYDQNQVLAAADQLAQQIAQMPDNVRSSQLEMLKREDFVMYAVVNERMKDLQRLMRQEQAAAHGGAMTP